MGKSKRKMKFFIPSNTFARVLVHHYSHINTLKMPRGSGRKHSKNAGNMGSENLNYAERKALGFGTIKERLGKDTVKDFNCCSLGLHVCADPYATDEGVLYEREFIVRNLIEQKKSIEKMKLSVERLKMQRSEEEREKEEHAKAKEIKKFHAQNHGGGKYQEMDDVFDDGDEKQIAKRSEFGSKFDKERAESLNEFWTNTVRTKENVAESSSSGISAKKNSLYTKCPQTGKKLRAKDLTKVKWTKATDDESVFICPVTMKTFTNSTPIVVLKPTGDAISKEAYDLVIKKEGAYEGKKVDPKKDVIHLQRGGTGFAASGTQVESKIETIIGQGSGRADIRGQNASAPSRFGLRM